MKDKFEGLIRSVYRMWKADNTGIEGAHPDEEGLVCFLEGRLSEEENERIKSHLISCAACAEAVAVSLDVSSVESKDVPEELLNRVKDLWLLGRKPSLLEISLKVKERLLEIINTTGDILVGSELVPAVLLRSRKIQDFKDEVTILKDFKDIRVQAKIENKGAKAFSLIILVKEKQAQRIIKDLRITLLKDGLELESYLTDSASVTFEHVFLGKYMVEIVSSGMKLASILLDIKV